MRFGSARKIHFTHPTAGSPGEQVIFTAIPHTHNRRKFIPLKPVYSVAWILILSIIPMLLVLLSFNAQAGTNTIDLQALTAPKNTIKAMVTADGVAWFQLVTTEPSGKDVRISLIEFRDEHDNPVDVHFKPTEGTNEVPQTEITKKLDQEQLTLWLDAQALSPDKIYTGELTIEEPDHTPRQLTIQLDCIGISIFRMNASIFFFSTNVLCGILLA